MGVIPVHPAHSAKAGDHCRLCAEAAARESATAGTARGIRLALPMVLVLSAALILAALDDGTLRAVGVGVIAGIVSAMWYVAVRRSRFDRRASEAHAARLEELTADADGRVRAVITQFAWAVNDVATLRNKLDEADALVRTLSERARERKHQNEQLVRQISRLRERLTEIAMAASVAASRNRRRAPLRDAPTITWGADSDGRRTRLALQIPASGQSPARVRLVDRDGEVVAASSAAVVSVDGNIEFELEPPPDLLADLDAGREITYDLETFVGKAWTRALLKPATKRTGSVELHARLLRASETAGPADVPASRGERRSPLH